MVRYQPCRRGFTLMELVVVVAIVGVLIAILLPYLGRARENARTARCVANLKQIGVALHTYASENDDYTPPRGIDSTNLANPADWPGPPHYPTFASAVWSDQILLGQYAGSTNGDNTNPQYIYGGVNRRSVFVCPSDQYHVGNDQGIPASYGLGTNFTFASYQKRRYRNMWQMTKIIHPELELVMVDGFNETFAPGGFSEPYTFYGAEDATEKAALAAGGPGLYSLSPDPTSVYNWSKRHNGGANVLFLDGRATFLPDLKPAYDQKQLMMHVVVE